MTGTENSELAINPQSLDEADPLKPFRERFYTPKGAGGVPVIYLTGNSLGLQPKAARTYVEHELDDWARLGVDGHVHARHPWLSYHEFLTESMARVVGAQPVETVAMNSLTMNLHLLMVSFYRPTRQRYKIMIEKGAFPSDRYAVESQIRFHGFDPVGGLIEIEPRDGETALRTSDIINAVERHGSDLALVLFGGVNYYTGQAFDIKAITDAGKRSGCVVGFDLAHAAGNLELRLHDWNVDFAAWCSYKYLNGGPGAVAGAFVHERHASSFQLPRFAGWWGHEKDTRFLMRPEFVPMAGAEGWQISNPPILQMAALRASLEIFDEVGMPKLRAKSKRLTEYTERCLMSVVDERISIITPAERGCQLSIRVRNADKSLFDNLTARGVVADWREPDVIRVAPVPLYNTFTDVAGFVEILRACLT